MSVEHEPRLSISQCASLACVLEATAPKLGNVYRGADFDDLTYGDLVVSAVALGPHIERAATAASVGQAVLGAIESIEELVGRNTYLGTVLLLAPLAAVPRTETLSVGIGGVLKQLTAADARDVYAAIRLARPGGLGRVAAHDVSGPPPDDLVAAMASAAERDLVARQFANGFREVLDEVVPWLEAALALGLALPEAIVHTQLTVMAAHGDSLVGRKCGPEVAREVAERAAAILKAGAPGSESYQQGLADFDFWLRADGHRRNPGTTADLIAAGLFAMLREGRLRPPFRI
ncbi:MAG: triphosphoribosyl-dephospho-CoA synthase [Pirellulales bacterium]